MLGGMGQVDPNGPCLGAPDAAPNHKCVRPRARGRTRCHECAAAYQAEVRLKSGETRSTRRGRPTRAAAKKDGAQEAGLDGVDLEALDLDGLMALAKKSLAAGATNLDVNAARAILQYGEELKQADAGQWDGTGACPTCGNDEAARTVFVLRREGGDG